MKTTKNAAPVTMKLEYAARCAGCERRYVAKYTHTARTADGRVVKTTGRIPCHCEASREEREQIIRKAPRSVRAWAECSESTIYLTETIDRALAA